MPAVSKAQRFAQSAEAIGDWIVERKKFPDRRVVTVTREAEKFQFTWRLNENGLFVFGSGRRRTGDIVEPWANVKEALRIMAAPPAHIAKVGDRAVRLPFNPGESSDEEIVVALSGTDIEWLNPFSEVVESSTIPRVSKKTKVDFRNSKESPVERIITFIGQPEKQFRSVRINSITKVVKA